MIFVEVLTNIVVKKEDIDELGHVNNSVYVTYIEKGRYDWYVETGLSLDQMIERNIGTVIIKLEVLFKKEAKLGDRLTVKTSPVRMGTKSYVFEQTIIDQDGELVTEAIVTNVMFDLIERKGIPVIDEIARYFKG